MISLSFIWVRLFAGEITILWQMSPCIYVNVTFMNYENNYIFIRGSRIHIESKLLICKNQSKVSNIRSKLLFQSNILLPFKIIYLVFKQSYLY